VPVNPRILVLPGIGDIYWVLVKLEAFCRREGLGTPEVHVWDLDGRARGLDFLERVPFVTVGEYWKPEPGRRKGLPREFQESYHQARRVVYPHFRGFDYYIAVNGQLRHGRSVDEAMPGLDSNWMFPLEMRVLPEDAEAAAIFQSSLPERYIVAHFSKFGMFEKWVQHWNAKDCAEYVRRIEAATGYSVILTGSKWDEGFASEITAAGWPGLNLVGLTGPAEFYALWRGASGCIGWCGGNTILATALRVPTQIIWSRTHFPAEGFWRFACPPEADRKWYDYGAVEDWTPARAAERFVKLLA
jgi:hypothetical protein